jgi:hypothetical protein
MLKIETNVIDVREQLKDLAANQMPFAVALALTRTAYNAKELIKQRLPGILDRPTPWTLNALYVVSAKKDQLWTTLEYRQWASKGTPSGRVMEHHAYEGPRVRRSKRSEVLLRQKGVLKSDEYLVPSRLAKLNAYGNVPGSYMMKMLSSLQAMTSTSQNSTAKAKKTAFFATRRSGTVVIYERRGKTKIRPVFIGIGTPHYKAVFDMDGLIEIAFNRTFEYNLQAAMEQASATAK